MMDDGLHKVYQAVELTCKDDASGHDWWHILRVVKLALFISERENANSLTVELAALLHDVDDWKLNGAVEGCPVAHRILHDAGFCNNDDVQLITHTIGQVSFKGAGVNTTPTTLEAKVVQDADRLDAIGAIGVARAFAYGGARQRQIYIPGLKPQLHQSFDEYQHANGSTINHFYEKLLLLKDRLNTQTARQIAVERHQFMELFLAQFFKEWSMFD
jgi:uncharacterized protein